MKSSASVPDSASKRGRFQFGPTVPQYADPFGFFANEETNGDDVLQLIVFPELYL